MISIQDKESSRLQREPTIIRFERAALNELARERSQFLIEEDLNVTQSDIVEPAVIRALLDHSLRDSLRAGTLDAVTLKRSDGKVFRRFDVESPKTVPEFAQYRSRIEREQSVRLDERRELQ